MASLHTGHAGDGVSVLVITCTALTKMTTQHSGLCCAAYTKRDLACNETRRIPPCLMPHRPDPAALRLRWRYAYLTNEKKRTRLIAIHDRITTVP
jgi:hypothetical protein